jgi:hypothetical protein
MFVFMHPDVVGCMFCFIYCCMMYWVIMMSVDSSLVAVKWLIIEFSFYFLLKFWEYLQQMEIKTTVLWDVTPFSLVTNMLQYTAV